MKPMLKRYLAAIVLMLSFVARSTAAPIDDGVTAFNRSDFPTALKLLRPLAEHGNATAQVFLGQMYDFGYGVSQDYAESFEWYRKAADQGNPVAQSLLAYMYKAGRGVPQDYVRAHMWWNLAAASGDPFSAKYRDEVAALMTPAQVAEAQKLASEWKKSIPLASEHQSQHPEIPTPKFRR
jgi:TPR repeat protein